jgi:hypothetical protein
MASDVKRMRLSSSFVTVTHRWISDSRIRAWMWILPVWSVFMFVYGILIETRIFGELIPLVTCATMLIVERILIARMGGVNLISIVTKEEGEIIGRAA